MRSRSGFTLIELLVVITIIVVLLALLTPALNQAVYQAELVACSSQQRALVSAALTYSIDWRRDYPHRSAVHDPNAAYSSSHFRNPDSGGDAMPGSGAGAAFGLIGHDDRPEIETYIPNFAQMLLDPLAGNVDYGYAAVERESWIGLPYNIYFGFSYARQAGLKRRGGKINAFWGSTTALIADLEQTGTGIGKVALAHPDRIGSGALIQQQNFTVVEGAWKQTLTFWNLPLRQRGLIDRNVGFQDGSVVRYAALDLTPADTPTAFGDHPMRPLPFDKLQDAMDSGTVTDTALWVPSN